MTEKYHDDLCRIAAKTLGVNWNDFETEIVSETHILITLDSTGESYLVSQ